MRPKIINLSVRKFTVQIMTKTPSTVIAVTPQTKLSTFGSLHVILTKDTKLRGEARQNDANLYMIQH